MTAIVNVRNDLRVSSESDKMINLCGILAVNKKCKAINYRVIPDTIAYAVLDAVNRLNPLGDWRREFIKCTVSFETITFSFSCRESVENFMEVNSL